MRWVGVSGKVGVSEEVLGSADAVTVLTGAGISTASGIPDFRGPQGLWTRNPAAARMFDIDAYVNDPEVRIAAWQARRDHAVWHAEPNAGHAAIADLERQGRLRALVTQNIDGLHQAAGNTDVLEAHGTIHRVICLECGDRRATPEVLARVDAGEADPRCQAVRLGACCTGLLKVDTVSFGQSLDPRILSAAMAAARTCDALLACGTSLQVQPIAGMVDAALGAGIPVIIANAQPTPYDARAAAVVRDALEDCLPRLLAATL